MACRSSTYYPSRPSSARWPSEARGDRMSIASGAAPLFPPWNAIPGGGSCPCVGAKRLSTHRKFPSLGSPRSPRGWIVAKRKSSSGTKLRGYGSAHKRLRRAWDLKVQAGGVRCARCHCPIVPGTPWDLGHDDHDRTKYNGAEHRRCNRGAPRRKRKLRTSRDW